MSNNTVRASVLSAVLSAAMATPLAASAAEDAQLVEIREQIRVMQQAYEARLQALEQRLQQVQAAPAPVAAAEPAAVAAAPAPVAAAANAFNPNIALILGGGYARLSQDPNLYRLQGFMPSGGEVGPGQRGFNLGESELTLGATIDPVFAGQLTFSLSGENTVSVEEAIVRTHGLSNGVNLKAGRFLSALGYLNSQHAHAWDFIDAPLAYQAFFGGQYKADGVQATWLAPTDRFVELGIEVSSGAPFPGNARNKNGLGASALLLHVGDDIGASSSWRTGLSYLHTGATRRAYDDPLSGASNAFSGKSALWVADAIYKWAPNGNPVNTNFKLQGEYFHRNERGTLEADPALVTSGPASGAYASAQSGWYLQGVYQFMPLWRAGLRYDRLDAGNVQTGVAGAFPLLDAYTPKRASVMVDYSPSEFSRLRLQLAVDQSRPGASDQQILLQYIMSLGTHAAHTF